MNILFSPSSKTYLYLGRKIEHSNRLFEGPRVYATDGFYYLTAPLLQALLQQFEQDFPDAIYASTDQLDDLLGDSFGVQIGGDADDDVRLPDYFTPLGHPESVAQIQSSNLKLIEQL